MEVRSVEAIVQALSEAGVKYLIVGGIAVNAHGYERLTVDVDLVIGLEHNNIVRGLHALEQIDYHLSIPISPEQFADPKLRQEWHREKGMLVLKLWSDAHRRTPIDVFIFEPFDFNAEYSKARWEIVMGTIKASVVPYETLLEMKKSAGRAKDLLDVEALRKLDPYR